MNTLFFEDIQNKCLESNSKYISILEEHFKLILIESVEYTGVGCYINLNYKELPVVLLPESLDYLEFNYNLYINDMEDPFLVLYTISSKGLIGFIEIVAAGCLHWDGIISSWKFEFYEEKQPL